MMLHAKSQRGFSLMELIVAVAIVGVLLAVALPRYSAYTLRGNRTDGMAILNEIMQAQERYAADRGTYVSDLTQLGYDAVPKSEKNLYEISAAVCGAGISLAECVQLTATAQGNQANDENGNSGNLTFNSRGTKVGW